MPQTGGAINRPKPKKAPVAKMMKSSKAATTSKAGGQTALKSKKYLAKSSGTTRGEVRGVLQQLRTGKISKGTAIKDLKGGPRAGVPAGNKKKVAKAIKRAR